MRKYNATIFFFCLAGFFPGIVSEQVFAQEAPEHFVISTGLENGVYWHTGNRLKTVAGEMGLDVSAVESKGSLDNLDKLLDSDSPVNMTFAQADVLQHHLNRYPSDRSKLDILESIGQQCVFIVTGLNSDIRDADDIQDADDLHLGIDTTALALAATFDYMATRLLDLEDVDVVFEDASEILAQLYKKDADINAFLLVSPPRAHTEDFKYVLDNPHRYRLVELDDDDLTGSLQDGRQIYHGVRLALPGANKPIRTICARGVLLANRHKLSMRQRNQLTDLVSYQWMRIYGSQ